MIYYNFNSLQKEKNKTKPKKNHDFQKKSGFQNTVSHEGYGLWEVGWPCYLFHAAVI